MELVTFKGKIVNVLYQKDGFLIGVFEKEDGDKIKIIGEIHQVIDDEELIITGKWEEHYKYGKQLKVLQWEKVMPSTEKSAIDFLTSGLIRGVGKTRAKKIVDELGSEAVKIIYEKGTEALKNIRGIGGKTAEIIVKSIRKNYEVQEIISELSKFDIPTSIILKLYRKYESQTLKKVYKNPYIITEIKGINFFTVDEIARKMGIPAISGYRISACIIYTLHTLTRQNGHTFIYLDDLINKTQFNLNKYTAENEHIDKEQIEQTIYSLEDRKLIAEDNRVYPKKEFQYEVEIARNLSKIRNSENGEAMSKINDVIKKYQKANNIILANEQRQAIKTLLEESVLVINGNPGTGKTTVVKAIVDIYKELHKDAIIQLCAPTGRASKRLEEVTGCPASTIHRMIGYVQGEQPLYNKENKLECDLVIVDEFSMADLEITYLLLEALPNHAKLLLIGDTDQLPSVGVGNVLHDLVASGIPTIRLTEIFRQAKESQIILNAHRINNGIPLLIDEAKNDFYFIHQSDINIVQELIAKSVLRFLDLGYLIDDILVLSPVHKGTVGVAILNEELREILNPHKQNKKEIKIGNRIFREGDKVLQTVNDPKKEVFNGEMGIIRSITKEYNKNDQYVDVVICEFDDKLIKYYRNDMLELELGYAITVHKSQGSEAKVVIMPVVNEHSKMLTRNLCYTGITRAREKVVLIGTIEAMNKAIQNNRVIQRNSTLDMRINENRKYVNKLAGKIIYVD